MASQTTNDKLDQCCLTEYQPLSGTPKGKLIDIGGINTYYIQGNDQDSKEKAIVILTDVFGLTKNPRITADELCEKSGFDVYVPDILNGDPIPSSMLKDVPDTPGEKMSFGTKLGFVGKMFTSFGPWLFRHRQNITLPIVEQFLKNLRLDRGIKRIEAVGYCFGGLYALLVGRKDVHLIDAVVGCHVSQSNQNHYEQLNVPVAFACAEEDNQFSNDFRIKVEQILQNKKDIPYKFLLTEGTVHGFAARPNPDNPVIMKAYEQANDLIVEWAKTHL